MAKVETKDRQEQQSGSPRQDGSPFDTGMIERELDDLLRQRKLARQGRGLEELLGETHGEEGRDGPEEPDEAKPRQQQEAPNAGAQQMQADGPKEKNASPQERQEGPEGEQKAEREQEPATDLQQPPDGGSGDAAPEGGAPGADEKGVVLHLHKEGAAHRRQDGEAGEAHRDGEEPEKGRRAPRRPAKIAKVRSFVQTRFEEQEIEQDGMPVEEQHQKFVVTLPEEVYQIGKSAQPGQDGEQQGEAPALTLEQYITGDIPAEPEAQAVAPRDAQPSSKGKASGKGRKLIDSREPAGQGEPAREGDSAGRGKKPSLLDPLFEEEPQDEVREKGAPRPHPLDEQPGKGPVKALLKRAKAASLMVKCSALLLLAQLSALVFAFTGVPEFLGSHARMAWIAFGLLAVQMVLGMEVVLGAADEWRQRRPSTCNLVLLVCLLCLLQTGIDGASGGAIVTLYPSLLLFAALCNRRALLRKAAADGRLVRSSRKKWVPAVLQTGDEPPLRVLVSEQRTSFEGYFTRLFALSDVDKLSCLLLPAGALLGVLYLLLNRQSSQPMPTLTVLLCAFGAVTPFSLLRAYDAPYARLSGTLRRRGSTLAGCEAAKQLSSLHEVLLTDDEFFGSQMPIITGVKLYNGHSLEESVLVTASLAHILKLPVEHALLAMLDNRADRLMNLTEIKYLEGGGLSAFVGGTVAMLGNEQFMKQNMIHVPRDDVAPVIEKNGRVPLYLACGGHMAAVFSVDYTIAPANARMLSRLTKAGVGLLLSTMDPLMTGELAEWIALLDAGSVRTISPGEREELLRRPHEQTEVMAVSISDNPLSMAWSLLAASQLRTAMRIGSAVVVLAVAAGATLCGVLLQTGAIRALGLTGIMLFELAWALPVWCVTLLTTRINR